jgi:membrane-associated phospholipid phosphatase
MSTRTPKSPAENPAPSVRGLVVSALMLAAAMGLTLLASRFIDAEFPRRVAPQDLMFRLLPHVQGAEYLADAALVAGLVILVAYLARFARRELPDVIAAFALAYALRAVMLVLTPMAMPHGSHGAFGILPIAQNGMFPSAHTATSTLSFMLIDVRRAPALRRAATATAAIVWISLLVAHAHYSIDITGGLLLAYFVSTEWKLGRLFDPIKRLLGDV